MIAIRSQSWSASSRYCVVRNTVVPRPLIRRNSSQTVRRLAAHRGKAEVHLGNLGRRARAFVFLAEASQYLEVVEEILAKWGEKT